MNEELDNKTKKELIKIAKNSKIRGYSKLNKQELFNLITNHRLKQNLSKSKSINKPIKNQNKESIEKLAKNKSKNTGISLKKSKNNLRNNFLPWLPLGILIFAALGFFGIDWKSCSNSKKEDIISEIKFNPKNASFNILILPLNPDRECKNENTDYENLIISHYKELKSKLSLNINTKFYNSNICPQTDEEAKNIGIAANASLVIWGQYEERCIGEMKVRIRYYLVKNANSLINKKIGDTKMKQVNQVSDIRSGYLLENTDNIIYRNIAIQSYRLKNYNEAVNLINQINIDSCDIELLAIKSLCLQNQDMPRESLIVWIEASGCVKSLILDKKNKFQKEIENFDDLIHFEIQVNKLKAFIFYSKRHWFNQLDQNKGFLNEIENNNKKAEEYIQYMKKNKNWL